MDDDDLLAVLGDALRAREPVGDQVLAAARGAFAFRELDAELAALLDDSATADALAGFRSATSDIRHLTFGTETLTVDVDLDGGDLVGQVTPARPGVATVVTPGGAVGAPIDEDGLFTVAAPGRGPLRLHLALEGDPSPVVTAWFGR